MEYINCLSCTKEELEIWTKDIQIEDDNPDEPGYLPIYLSDYHYFSLDSNTIYCYNCFYIEDWLDYDEKNTLKYTNIQEIFRHLPDQRERAIVQYHYPVDFRIGLEIMKAYQYLAFIKALYFSEFFSEILSEFDEQIFMSIYSKKIYHKKISSLLRFTPELLHITKEQEIQYPKLWKKKGDYDYDWTDNFDIDYYWNGPKKNVSISWEDWEYRDYWKKFLKIS